VALAAIELRNVSVTFDTENLKESVLEQLSFVLFEGERLVLIGPSGQGKSVLMKVMAGLIPPTKGQVFIYGEDLYAVPMQRKHQLMCQMGMLFQKNALFDSLTNFENIAFPLREVTQLSLQEIESTVDKFMDAVGISHAKKLYPEEISGGMQKRLGIARALALNPKIIFYDDPTAGLDPITSRKIVDLILELGAKNNQTVIAVTNEMARAYQMATRIVMVSQRGIIETGTPTQTKTHPNPIVKQFVHGEASGPLMGFE